MENIKEIILTHLKKYPKMEVVDLVKLIYQNEFGGGHLLFDLDKAKSYLEDEYNKVKDDNKDIEIEYIGNGFYRYYLYKIEGSIDNLFELFKNSNLKKYGSIESFKEKLNKLVELVTSKQIPFDKLELISYINNYEKEGFPIVSHSKIYKENYNPAYRVIRKD